MGRGIGGTALVAPHNSTFEPDLWDSVMAATASELLLPRAPSYIDMDLEIRFIMYTVCGFIVMVVSSLVMIVFTCTKEFRTKYALFNALAVADFINGLSFAMAGIFRGQYMHEGHYFIPTTNSQCIWETPWAIFMIVSGHLPALLNLCLSLERVVALEFSSWYRRVWREYHKHYLVMACFLLTGVLFVGVLFLDKFHQVTNEDRICAVMNSTGIVFGTVHYSVCALIFFICFIILVVIFHKTNTRRKPTKDERRRQKMLVSITAISVFLVSIPYVVLILNEWKIPEINPVVVGIAYCLYALHSAMSLPIYIYFRPDFRNRFLTLFLRKNLYSSETTTVNVNKVSSENGKMTTIQ